MLYLADRIGDGPRPAAAGALLEDVHRVTAWYGAFGDALTRREPPPPAVEIAPLLRGELLASVRAAGSPDEVWAAVATFWGGMHLYQLELLAQRCAQAVAAKARA